MMKMEKPKETTAEKPIGEMKYDQMEQQTKPSLATVCKQNFARLSFGFV